MIKYNHITGRQIAAALGLARMTQAELAKAANVSIPTIGRMIASEGPAVGMANNVAAIRAALEAAGVEFIAENGGGPGVRLKKAE
ncbi:helix-turn-helix domain-containing protein [Methylocystis sp. ATCC 49242]|uniref:helix-turn-helix domain-containing protein n=1 Tax=Methylocystis sp. ATCC 49242 TaxID=622637 RepID=UPI0002FB1115|nr:helix-turn-helix domain-containing protein [Methylocystis sp. ATCC 49242]